MFSRYSIAQTFQKYDGTSVQQRTRDISVPNRADNFKISRAFAKLSNRLPLDKVFDLIIPKETNDICACFVPLWFPYFQFYRKCECVIAHIYNKCTPTVYL